MNIRPFAALLLLLGAGCGNKSAATADAGKGPSTDAAVAILDAGAADAAAPADAGTDATAPDTAPAADPVDLNLRGKHLLEAIVKGDPKLAADIVYPREAYIATHEHADPGKFWDKKVYPGFERDMRTVRKRLHLTEQAQFVSLDLGPQVAQVMPKKRDLKVPVWRVRHSKITFTLGGKTQRVEIAEMTGWHGAWYVSKLR